MARPKTGFDKWLIKKEKLDRGLQLLQELDVSRADSEDEWKQVTMSCAAIDRLVFERPNFRPRKTRGAGNSKIECMYDLWLKWTREHHVFTFVRLSKEESDKFSNGAKQQTMEQEQPDEDGKSGESGDNEGAWILMSLQYFFPAKPKKKGDKPRPLTSDQKAKNQVFLRVCRNTWAETQGTARGGGSGDDAQQKGTLMAKVDSEILRRLEGREQKDEAAADSKNGSDGRDELDELTDWALNKLGVRRLAMWVEQDADNKLAREREEREEKLANAKKTHEGFVKTKDKLRIPIAKLTQGDRKPNGGWKPPRFDFGGGKGNVRANKNVIPRTSVDLMANSGLKYIHALSKGKQGRDGDLERCNAQLKKVVGREAIKKEREAEEERAAGAEEAFSEWLEQKRKKEEAVSHLGLIDKPHTFDDAEDHDFKHYINIGRMLKAVDQNLYQDWVDWSTPEGSSEPFRGAQVSLTWWDSFAPIGCDVCNRVYTGLQGTLTKLLRPGVDYKAAFERQFERVWKRRLAEDDNYRLTESDKRDALKEMKLTKRQMRTLLSRELGIVMQPDEMRRLIDAFDENHDGEISRKEFLKFTGESRSANRGDTKQRLRTKCTWQTTCPKTGMPNAFTVYTVTAENATPGDDVISWQLSNGERRQRVELAERRRREELLRSGKEILQSGEPLPYDDGGDDDEYDDEYDDDAAGDDDDDEYGDDEYDDDDDDGEEEGGGRGRGKKRGGALKQGKCQAANVSDMREKRDRALRKLRRLSRENRQSKQLEDIMANGSPPAAPRLWAAGLDDDCPMALLDLVRDEADCESDDSLTHDLWLCWAPARDSTDPIAFYSLEFSGAEGSREQRQNLFRERTRDPPSARDPVKYMFHVENLAPNTTYSFRLRACNGFGPGPFILKDFTTRPDKPPMPQLVKASPTTVTLRWKFSDEQMEKMAELKRLFDGIDADHSGTVSRDELKDALRANRDLVDFLESAMADVDDGGGAPASVFDAIETDDDETLSWEEFRGYFQNLGFSDGSGADAAGAGAAGATSLSNRTPGEMLTRYVLEQCESFGDKIYKKIWQGGTHEATLSGLKPGTSYRFRVRTMNRHQVCGVPSESVVVNTMLERPSAPTISTKRGAITCTSVALRWTGQRPDAKGTRSQQFVDTMLAQWTNTEGASDEGVDVRRVFDTYDTDRSGSIDTRELSELLRDLGVTPTDVRVREAMEEMDENSDGTIDFQEFNAWWTGDRCNYVIKRDEGLTAEQVTRNLAEATLALKTKSKHKSGTASTSGGANARSGSASSEGTSSSSSVSEIPLPAGAMVRTCFRGSARSCQITGLEPNSLYNFRLRATNPSSFSTLSPSLQVMTAPCTPHAPVTIECQQRSVRLKWYAGPGGTHKYILQQQFVEALDAKFDRSAAAFAKRMEGQKSWATVYDGVESVATVLSLYPNSVYRFRVQSINKLGVGSAFSEATQVSTEEREGQYELRPGNAEEAFTIECNGDVVAGDTILFQERLYVDENDNLVESSGGGAGGTGSGLLSHRGGAGAPSRLDMSVSSIGSAKRRGGAGGRTGTGGSFIGERTVAATVLKEAMSTLRGGETITGRQQQQWPRKLRMEVIWSTVSRSAASKHILSKGTIVQRNERSLFAFETFRRPWEHDRRRKRADEEQRCTDRGDDGGPRRGGWV